MPRRKKKNGKSGGRKGGRQRLGNVLIRGGAAALGSTRSSIVRCPGVGMPSAIRVSLVYTETLTFSVTTGSISSQTFFGNGLYDPDVTGTGGQPSWFDQLALIYTQYVVLGASILTTVKGGSATVPCDFVGVPLSGSGPTALSDQDTNPGAKRLIGLVVGTPAIEMLHTVRTCHMLGMKNDEDVMSRDECFGTPSTNPTAGGDWYMRFKAQATDGLSTSLIYTNHKFVFDAVFRRLATADNDVVKKIVRPDAKALVLSASGRDSTRLVDLRQSNNQTDTKAVSVLPQNDVKDSWGDCSDDELDYASFLQWKSLSSSRGTQRSAASVPTVPNETLLGASRPTSKLLPEK